MNLSRYTEEQIAYALRQVDGGTPATEVCRKMGISEQTFYTWRRRYLDKRARVRHLPEVPGRDRTAFGQRRTRIKP